MEDWKEVCRPKNQGGLGLKPLHLWNEALMVKYLWNIENSKDSLWVKWVKHHRLKNRSIWDIKAHENTRWGWKKITQL